MADELTTFPRSGDPECSIDLLVAEELVLLFQFLSLYEKLISMRVCKKWYHILRDGRMWKVIDFEEKGPVIKEVTNAGYRLILPSRKRSYLYTTYWHFPKKEQDILGFLQLHASGFLKEIYLTYVTSKVLDYLCINCPNLKTLSLFGAKYNMDKYKISSVEELRIPSGIESLDFIPPMRKPYHAYDEQILIFLSRHPNLRYLKLCRFKLSILGMQSLVQKENVLQEIQIFYHIWNYDTVTEHELDDVLTPSVGTLTTLDKFGIECYSDIPESNTIHRIDNLLNSIGKWENLKVLALKGVKWSDEAFASMIPGILNLESLKLEGGRSPTSSDVTLVGQHLKKIKCLQLGNGKYTTESFKTLLNHPTLEEVSIFRDIWHSSYGDLDLLNAIYDVLITLPKLKKVMLEGDRWQNLHLRTGHFPVIETAEIVVNDCCDEPF